MKKNLKNTRFLIVYILIIAAGLYINLHSDAAVPTSKSLREFPIHNKEWRMNSELTLSEDVLEKLRPTGYVSRHYIGDEKVPVYLYIGYHDGGKDSGEIHSPKHCLPGSGWYELMEDKMSIDVGLKKINLVRAVYQKNKENELFFYWYQVRGKSLSNEYALKFAEITSSMFHSRRDSTFIRVSVPFESDEKKAFFVGVKFIRDFYPVIEEFLPK